MTKVWRITRTSSVNTGFVAACLVLVLLQGCKAAVREEATKTRPEMLAVGPARFEMGCAESRDEHCPETEQPQHSVHVAAFHIDRTEVSSSDYALCVESGHCSRPTKGFDPITHPKRPVAHVTWEQAAAFCIWNGKRLPTEAEWELAARGTDGRIFPWGDARPTCAHAHTSDCGDAPADVGHRHLGASPFGVLDMAGNVDEWVGDLYRPYAVAQGTPASGERVARGGAYDAWHSRTTARSALQPDYHDALLGFRCAL